MLGFFLGNMIEYCLLYPISSVLDFLIEYFGISKNTAKFYFDKKFLARSFPAKTILKLPLDFVNDLEINPSYEGVPIEIAYEDDTFLVLNKPSNIHCHPLTYSEKNNCLSYLRSTRREELVVNAKKYDRGLLYRLDFETSGVLVYIKNEEAYHYLRNNFKEVMKTKKYICWVKGDCKLTGHFKHFFKATEEKGKKIQVQEENTSGDLKEGELWLATKQYSIEKNATLMEVILGHGLRHQIRAQLAFLGFPLLGDVFYGGPKAERLYLHALTYKLFYQNKEYQFNVEANF